jgi:hypothetical protein
VSYGVERLTKEPELLQEQKKRNKQQMEDLAYKNYRAFIETGECIRTVHHEVQV